MCPILNFHVTLFAKTGGAAMRNISYQWRHFYCTVLWLSWGWSIKMEGDIETWPNYCIGSGNASGETTDTAGAFASPAHIMNSAKRTENLDGKVYNIFRANSEKSREKE